MSAESMLVELSPAQVLKRMVDLVRKQSEQEVARMAAPFRFIAEAGVTAALAEQDAKAKSDRTTGLPTIRKLTRDSEKAEADARASEEAVRLKLEKHAAELLPLLAARDRAVTDAASVSHRLFRQRYIAHRACFSAYQLEGAQTILRELDDAMRDAANAEKDWVIRAGLVAAMLQLRTPKAGTLSQMVEGSVEPIEDLPRYLAEHFADVGKARTRGTDEARARALTMSKTVTPAPAWTPTSFAGARR